MQYDADERICCHATIARRRLFLHADAAASPPPRHTRSDILCSAENRCAHAVRQIPRCAWRKHCAATPCARQRVRAKRREMPFQHSATVTAATPNTVDAADVRTPHAHASPSRRRHRRRRRRLRYRHRRERRHDATPRSAPSSSFDVAPPERVTRAKRGDAPVMRSENQRALLRRIIPKCAGGTVAMASNYVTCFNGVHECRYDGTTPRYTPRYTIWQ